MNLHKRKSVDYEIVDHTADIGIRLRASSLEELFQGAALAFYDLLVESSSVESRETRRLHVEADAVDELMVAWLSELLYLFETERFLACRVQIEHMSEHELEARLEGEEFNPDKHKLLLLFKGVTFHQLEVRKTQEGWVAQVIFDV